MKAFCRSAAVLLLLCFLLGAFPHPFALAEEGPAAGEPGPGSPSEVLSVKLKGDGFSGLKYAEDRDEGTRSGGAENSVLRVTATGGIRYLYFLFDMDPGSFTLRDPETGASARAGQDGFLHLLTDLSSLLGRAPDAVEVRFPKGCRLTEVYALSDGTLPSWVQAWEKPAERADLLVVSTHADDEQLFFAGMLPYYAAVRGYSVQVVYMVSHSGEPVRQHERLNGLWTVGIRHYPVIGPFPDRYSESMKDALSHLKKKGYTMEDVVAFLAGNIRRFRPLVVAGQDFRGEYGHGQHIVCASALAEALEAAADPGTCKGSADLGTWSVPKAYFHLYDKNDITMDWDEPSDKLGGKTPFQVSQEGFACHVSQRIYWFEQWIFGTSRHPVTKASQIERYSPCRWGLYRTLVGPDEAGNDLFEHLVPWSETDDPVITEPMTEPVTEPITEPVTEPITEPATEPVTEPVTESAKPATEPATDPVGDPGTETAETSETCPAEDTRDPEETDREGTKGIGRRWKDGAAVWIAGGAALLALTVSLPVILLRGRKRK